MSLRRIRLELARTPDFPDGAADRGYEFVAPLTADGHLDHLAWPAVRDRCGVRRFWAGEAEEHGHLVHRGSGWAFHYDGAEPEDDEVIFKFDRHSFIPGDYVSVTEWDGEQRPFRVVSAEDLG